MREYYNNGCSLGHTPSMALLNDLNIFPFQERVAKLLKVKSGFKALRASFCKYRESGDSFKIFNFFIFCPNKALSELFSKIQLKAPKALEFF